MDFKTATDYAILHSPQHVYIRRKGKVSMHYYNMFDGFYINYGGNEKRVVFTSEDKIATDWEIVEEE